ncbi:hypothetical protein I79_006444 [Cricetulus griseus]|uniref:Uncharacterized protein n=1 Tax=Cricetulus griseus TaxID=10029 RepID=G3H7V1_CRIGR|nr:hypothetical protein I79_006444 [Cricetulus griseus]
MNFIITKDSKTYFIILVLSKTEKQAHYNLFSKSKEKRKKIPRLIVTIINLPQKET